MSDRREYNENVDVNFKQALRGGDTRDDSYLEYFAPVEVKVFGNFEKSFKMFRALVQKERILSDFKIRQRYEKPSEKKRRKQVESVQRNLEMESKNDKIMSGEYEKEKARKLVKKEKKMIELEKRRLESGE